MAHSEMMTAEVTECIENCMECARICLETSFHCLTMGGKHAEAQHIGLLNNCARICETAVAFMLSGSELHPKVCGVCAEVCQACEDDCERIDSKDATMKRCMEACAMCADSCRHMASAVR